MGFRNAYLIHVKLGAIMLREFRKGYFGKISSFSQFKEDQAILEILGSTIGTYIDIGSGRPVSGSNTWALYKLGWVGICVDPIRSNFLLHKILRPRDKFYRAIVGEGTQKLDFWETFPYEYSSTDKNLVSKLIATKKAKLINCYRVRSISINHLFASTKDARLLCIDAEGMDFEILKSLDFHNFRPELICIEDHEFNRDKSEIRRLMIDNNYRLEKNNHPSYIYYRND